MKFPFGQLQWNESNMEQILWLWLTSTIQVVLSGCTGHIIIILVTYNMQHPNHAEPIPTQEATHELTDSFRQMSI